MPLKDGDLLLVDAASLQEIGRLKAPEGTSYVDIWVVGTTAYTIFSSLGVVPSSAITPQIAPVPIFTNGFNLIDISTPAQPVVIGSYPLSQFNVPETIYLVGSTVYVSERFEIEVFDAQNISAVVDKGRMFYGSYIGIISDIAIIGNRIYSASYQSLAIANTQFGRSGEPTLLGRYTQPWNIDLMKASGQRLFSYNSVYDVSNPALPGLLTSEPLAEQFLGYHNDVEIIGNLAYNVGGSLGQSVGYLAISDVSDPRRPKLLSWLPQVEHVAGIEVIGSLAYLSGNRGLQVVDVSNPRQPKVVFAGADVFEPVADIAVANGRAYVLHGTQGLQVYDISSPSAPTLSGVVPLVGSATKITVAAGFAYIIGDRTGVQIFSLSNPDSPQLVASVEPEVQTLAVKVHAGRLHVTNYLGLRIYDIADPAQPVVVFGYDTPGDARSLEVVGDLLYIADTFGGLQILRITF